MTLNYKITLSAILVWFVRVLVILPFLNEDGGFLLEPGQGLPLIVDYFFSTIFFFMILVMFAVTYYFLPSQTTPNIVKHGFQITQLYFATFFVIDLIVEIGIFKRTFFGYIESIFLDYSPLLIPYLTGLVIHKLISKTN